MRTIRLKKKLLQQLYRPQSKKFNNIKKELDELEKAIDDATKIIFGKKNDSTNQKK